MPCSATSLSPFLKTDGFKFFAAHFLLCVLLFCRFLCIFAVWSDVLQRSCAILLAYLRFGTDVTTTARGILFLYAVSSHYGVFSFLICLLTYLLRSYELCSHPKLLIFDFFEGFF